MPQNNKTIRRPKDISNQYISRPNCVIRRRPHPMVSFTRSLANK